MSDRLKDFDISTIRLKSLVDKSGLTREEIAKRLDIDTSTVTKYYNGNRKLTIEAVRNFSQFFGVSADYLLGLSDAETNDKDIQFICDYTGLNEVSVRILNEFKRFHDFDFLNYLIKSSEISIGVDDYKATVERDSVFLKHAPIDLNKYFDIEEYIYSSENKYDKIAESLKRTLRSCLSVIDSVDLHYFRIIDSFKDCLNDFTAGKQKEIDRMRNQIRETLYKLEVKEYADNNEEE